MDPKQFDPDALVKTQRYADTKATSQRNIPKPESSTAIKDFASANTSRTTSRRLHRRWKWLGSNDDYAVLFHVSRGR